MSINLEAVSQTNQIYFNLQDIENASTKNLTLISEQIAALLENPLMKEEVTSRNHEKINDALDILNTIYSSDFLNDSPDEEDLKSLLLYFQRANAKLESGMEANGRLIQGFSLDGVDKEQLKQLMLQTFADMDEASRIIPDSIAPGPVEGSGVEKDMAIIGSLNDFIENLTDIYLKRYQDAASVTTDIYTAFSDLNIAISEMISSAEVDSEANTIQMDVSGLRTAIEELRVKLFEADPTEGVGIVNKLAAITFTGEHALEQATELAEGSGLKVAGGPDTYYLEVDDSAFLNITKAFDALTAENNQTGEGADKIQVPSGTLQAFQTAVESVNNRVSSDNQTLIERLRSVTNQQQQVTQLFSSLMKEMFESIRGFINKIS